MSSTSTCKGDRLVVRAAAGRATPSSRTAGRRRSSHAGRRRPSSATTRRWVLGLSRPVYQQAVVAAVAVQLAEDLHALGHVGALRPPQARPVVVDPLPGRGRPPRGPARGRPGPPRGPVPLQGRGHAEHGQRRPRHFETRAAAPRARARAVFVDALHAHVARGVGGRVEHLGQELLAGRGFNHELHGHARLAGPGGSAGRAAVADEVAG